MDQAQYWADPSKPYEYLSVSEIAEAFRNSRFGRSAESLYTAPYDKSQCHPSGLPRTKFAVSMMELVKACFEREVLLVKRHMFLYLNPLRKAQTIVPADDSEKDSAVDDSNQVHVSSPTSSGKDIEKKGMILPFQSLTMALHNVNYFVDMPKEIRKRGISETKLQLLSKVSGEQTKS